jgi:hypothetical protein
MKPVKILIICNLKNYNHPKNVFIFSFKDGNLSSVPTHKILKLESFDPYPPPHHIFSIEKPLGDTEHNYQC